MLCNHVFIQGRTFEVPDPVTVSGRFYMKASPVRAKCDAECKKRLLCDIVSGRSNARQVSSSSASPCATPYQWVRSVTRQSAFS